MSKTVKVEPVRHKNYVRKAAELERAANDAFLREDWTAAVTNAIHAAICLADAVCVFYLGVRSADQDHRRSVDLLLTVQLDRGDLERQGRHLTALLKYKNVAEYEERLLTEKESHAALDHLNRFSSWAKSKLP